MVRKSIKSFLVGTSRGALGGALVGAGLMFAGGALLALTAFPPTGPFIFAGTVLLGGLSGVGLFNPLVAPISMAVISGSAAIGAFYKGISEFVDAEETLQEKNNAVRLAQKVNEHVKSSPQRSVRSQFVPEQVPQGVAKDEVPAKWVEKEAIRNAVKATQAPTGHSH